MIYWNNQAVSIEPLLPRDCIAWQRIALNNNTRYNRASALRIIKEKKGIPDHVMLLKMPHDTIVRQRGKLNINF